jgi:hypothetical protein
MRLIPLWAAVCLLGCEDRGARQAVPPPSASKPTADPSPAPLLDLTVPRAVRQVAGHQMRIRQRVYLAQTALPAPEDLPDTLGALHTAARHKITGFTVRRHMERSEPTSGVASAMVRWTLMERGEALRGVLRGALEAQGWLAAGAPLRTWHDHPQRGRLHLNVEQPDSQPTRVEFGLEIKDPGTPWPAPAGRLRTPPPWLLNGLPAPGGFELTHVHGWRPAVPFSDVQRLAMWFSAPQAQLTAALENALAGAGYTRTPRTDRAVWKRADPWGIVALRPAGTRTVLVHQQRWRRDRASTEAAAPPSSGGR